MKVLIDTNIALDVILEREPFVESATEVFGLVEAGKLQGYVAATTITNIFYIVRKLKSREAALQAIAQLLQGLTLCEVNRSVIQQALSLNLKDFEDGVQLACAVLNNLDAITTRNEEDFDEAEFVVLSPTDLIARVNEGN
jgi:predicted nucleic acid-binding protein